MKELITGRVFPNGGCPPLYLWDKELSEKERSLMERFIKDAPSVAELEALGEEAEKLLMLHYLSIETECGDEERVTVIACPRSRCLELVSSLDAVAGSDELYAVDDATKDFINCLTLPRTMRDAVHALHCFREVEALLEEDEKIIFPLFGRSVEPVYAPDDDGYAAVFLTTKRVLTYSEPCAEESDLREIGFCFIDSLEKEELDRCVFRVGKAPGAVIVYKNEQVGETELEIAFLQPKSLSREAWKKMTDKLLRAIGWEKL